jgi:hypothetical protein
MRERIWQILPSYSGYKLERSGVDIFHTDYNLPDDLQLQMCMLAARLLNEVEEGFIKITLPRKGKDNE